jgi:quinol monooxygenase YgiN
MIVEYIRYRLEQHEPAEFVAAYEIAGSHLRAAPECLSYEVAQCDEQPATFVVRIQWTSASGHMEGFRRGPNFPPFLTAIRPFIPEIEEMRHYTPSQVSWSRPS